MYNKDDTIPVKSEEYNKVVREMEMVITSDNDYETPPVAPQSWWSWAIGGWI